MRFRKIQSLLLAVVMGFATLIISISLLKVSSALALERAGTGLIRLDTHVQAQQPSGDFKIIVVFTDPAKIQITDLSGNVIGEGEHGGEVRCIKNKCNQNTQLTFGVPLTDPIVYEYKFTTRQAFDPGERIVVVAGTGTISSRGPKERFSFTAIFQDNRDGTLSATYVASRPDASFIVSRSPGTFTIVSRP